MPSPSLLKSPYMPSWAACLFGLVLLTVGLGSMTLNKVYRDRGHEVPAVVTEAGRTGGSHSTSYVQYRFTPVEGGAYTGNDTGYSVAKGGTILVEYLPGSPWMNRVSGSGRRSERFLLPVTAAGLFFFWVGLHSARRLSRQRI